MNVKPAIFPDEMKREVEEEWLDRLPHDDPAARRSRADLRRINRVMGNERWICRTLARFPAAARNGIAEWGAGDGGLTLKILQTFPAATVSAYDLAPRPVSPGFRAAGERIRWITGDLFEQVPPGGGILVANLFLHHFEGGALRQLGRWCAGFEVLVFNEPDRARLPLILSTLSWPFINAVTRNDMPTSIRAGFRQDEIAGLMGLEPGRWKIEEHSTLLGARRLLAQRMV